MMMMVMVMAMMIMVVMMMFMTVTTSCGFVFFEHAVSANCAAYGSQGLETYGDDPIGCPWTSMMDTPEI